MNDWLFPLLMSLVLVAVAVATVSRKPGRERRDMRVLKGSAALLGGLVLVLMTLQEQG